MVMKKLDFRPHKSKEDFRKNYRLHDLAEKHGKNLLTQWGIDFNDFGEDQRYQKLWEKGKDKPDVLINVNGKKCLLDWKSKHKKKWILNKRAYDAYKEWAKDLSLKVVIAFFVFDEQNNLIDRRFAIIDKHQLIETDSKQWDKNQTVEFIIDLPEFTKPNLTKYCFE